MRVAFPDARIVDVGYGPETWPDRAAASGQCLLLWQEGGDSQRSSAALARLEAYLAERLGGMPEAAHRDGAVGGRMFGSLTRDYRLGFRLYGPIGACR